MMDNLRSDDITKWVFVSDINPMIMYHGDLHIFNSDKLWIPSEELEYDSTVNEPKLSYFRSERENFIQMMGEESTTNDITLINPDVCHNWRILLETGGEPDVAHSPLNRLHDVWPQIQSLNPGTIYTVLPWNGVFRLINNDLHRIFFIRITKKRKVEVLDPDYWNSFCNCGEHSIMFLTSCCK